MSENKHTPEPWEDPSCIKRFWSKVDVAGKDDCWVWQKGISGFGYGNFHYGNMSIRAHRFSYQLHNGKIRNHDCVCHSCDNPKCVNPAHLWIGTRAENNADKEAKKRGVYPVQSNGEANTNSILTTPEVIAARVMARKGLPQARIAKLLGVSTATVCMIVNGERRSEETEQRVSACVNACAGCATEVLETAPVGFFNSTYGHPKYLEEITKQRDELLADLAEAKRSAEFNFEQYQDVGRLLHEECEKTEKLLAALEHFATWARCQHRAQSKGCHATFDMMMLRDEIDFAEAAIASVKELK